MIPSQKINQVADVMERMIGNIQRAKKELLVGDIEEAEFAFSIAALHGDRICKEMEEIKQSNTK